jgi:hypothetical protein
MHRTAFGSRETLLRDNPRLVSRFKKHVRFGDFRINGCWMWTGGFRTGAGALPYSAISAMIDGKRHMVKAHRLALALNGRDVRPEFDTAHLCGNSLCVNPSHLVLFAPHEHRRMDRYMRQLRRMFEEAGVEAGEIIDHTPLWEGWDLPGYGAYLQEREAEIRRHKDPDDEAQMPGGAE